MDHLVALLDADHEQLAAGLSRELATALGIDVEDVATSAPHVTLVSYTGLGRRAATRALASVARATRPLTLRAHGYGVFTGGAEADLSLHIMVVRSRALDELQHRALDSLVAAGACVAGTTDPAVWTPHITLLGRGLTPVLLGRAVELLAHRPHRSWTIDVASLAVTRRASGSDDEPGGPSRLTVALG